MRLVKLRRERGRRREGRGVEAVGVDGVVEMEWLDGEGILFEVCGYA